MVAVVLVNSQYKPTNAKAEPTTPRYSIAPTATRVKSRCTFDSNIKPNDDRRMEQIAD